MSGECGWVQPNTPARRRCWVVVCHAMTRPPMKETCEAPYRHTRGSRASGAPWIDRTVACAAPGAKHGGAAENWDRNG